MNKLTFTRTILCMCLLFITMTLSACTKSPEQVREWMHDKRCPVKMQEFIQNERFGLDSKIEAVMVLTERGDCVDLPKALGEPLQNDEMNRIVAGVIERMNKLLETRPEYETKVKDAAYYLLKLDLNDENREGLTSFVRRWLDSDNFFLDMNKAGRVEQERLFREVLGSDSLPIYEHAIEKILDKFEDALAKELEKEKELAAKHKKYKVNNRPSDKLTAILSNTLNSLEALKIQGSNDMVAKMFLKRIEAKYPNMPRAYVLPFASNTSELLLPMAKRIVTDPQYKNETLNYYKDVMIATYYRNVQKKAGSEVCTTLLQTDRTGYLRWDCLELLTIDKGRAGVASLVQALPSQYEALKIPEDHPTFVSTPSMTFWNSLRVYCAHLPQDLNNQVPLEVFRELLSKGTTTTRMLSMACLSTLGEVNDKVDDVKLLASFAGDKTDIKDWGMQVSTMGELANFTSALLEKRLLVLANEAAAKNAPAAPAANAQAPAANAPAANAQAPAANAQAPAANAPAAKAPAANAPAANAQAAKAPAANAPTAANAPAANAPAAKQAAAVKK
ncbi:MAG: hypothetical protein IJU23_12730 [Proteobacteria bacterium]|nr:hypothetical protein [Pseudomonadota bacterium]